MAKKKKGGYLNRKTDPIASSSKTAGPATPAFCDGCGGGCGGCGDCERCNFGIVCEKCGGTGRAPVAAIPVVPEPSELEFAECVMNLLIPHCIFPRPGMNSASRSGINLYEIKSC